ncbi:MAG: secretion system protein F [Anaerolineales bacterium]|nr:secretion system protein F [Anaerolineales bacterium]
MADPNTIVIVTAAIGLILLVAGFVVGRASPSVVEERLGRYSDSAGMVGTAVREEQKGPDFRERLTDSLNQLGEGTDLFDNISRHLAQADMKLRPAEYIFLIVGASVAGFAIGMIVGRSIGFAILAGLFGFFIPPIYVGRAQRQRLTKFNNQLGDMLNLMVNGLRAGYSTLQAMEAVSKELPPPISDEFRRVVQEMQLGIPMEAALEHLLRRIDSDDLDLVITAINVQREVGGNLAEILDVISYTIRERVRIQGEIAALTAQGRATAWVISALPVILLLLLFLLNREYFMQFFNPETRGCGIPMLIVAGVMVISGFAIVQKIVNIDI